MRPRFVIFILLLVAAIFAVIYWLRPVKQTALQTRTVPESVQIASNTPVVVNNANQNVSNPQAVLTWPTNSTPTSSGIQQFIEKANEKYHKPIELYGQVVDQNSNPLSDVKIKISITQEQLSSPTTDGNYPINNNIVRFEKKTAVDGRFEITGEWGSALDIDAIQKDGYEVEPTPPSHDNIEGSFSMPVIFKMWSTNIHEQLITGNKSFHIVPDGKPYFIDLSKGEISQTEGGDLEVWVKRPEPITSRRYDWACEMDVLNGGLEPSDSYTMFLAPTNGYAQSAFQFEQKVGSGWGDSTGTKRFYLKLRNGQIYGSMSIEILAYYNNQIPAMIRLSYAINPSGSRILR